TKPMPLQTETLHCDRRRPQPRSPRGSRGFSLVELLTTVAAISSVAAVGVGVVTQVQTVTADIKLEEDVKQANNAIAVYLTAGGSLNELTDPQAVLDKLKSKVSEEEGNDR